MTFFQSLILGFVQGLTEFLPVSSSGHLILVPTLFGWEVQSLFFDVAVHVGTLLAVLVFFRKRIAELVLSFPRRACRQAGKRESRHLVWMIVLATVPALVAGVLLNDLVETVLRSPWVVIFNLVFWGVVLWIADWYRERSAHTRELEKIGAARSLIIGIAQALALIPGTSRSGITMSAGLFANLSRRAALEFSFLMSIPIIAASALLKGVVYVKDPVAFIGYAPLITGIVASFITGLFALWLLWKIARQYRFWPFALYRLLLGVFLLWWLL